MSRALDALVAEQVMGWTPTEYWCDNQPVRGLVPPDGGLRDVNRYPAYSSDLAAAWEVVEKMVEREWHPRITGRFSGPTDPWHVGFTARNCSGWNGRPDHTASHPDSLPTAICLAALKALHIPLPETV